VVDYDFELYSNFTFFLNDPENGDQIRQKEKRQIYGYKGSYQQNFSLLGLPLQHKMGLASATTTSMTRNFRVPETATLLFLKFKRGDIDELNAFAYISETWEVSPRFTVNAALRGDQLFFNYQSALELDECQLCKKMLKAA
jgi:hypothetical protein